MSEPHDAVEDLGLNALSQLFIYQNPPLHGILSCAMW